ncbi:MAG: hypothetical protein UU62_C0018G0026, partial [Candidatus Uhrbacteria bacterium GW2011_GWF2_41_40]
RWRLCSSLTPSGWRTTTTTCGSTALETSTHRRPVVSSWARRSSTSATASSGLARARSPIRAATTGLCQGSQSRSNWSLDLDNLETSGSWCLDPCSLSPNRGAVLRRAALLCLISFLVTIVGLSNP